MKDKAIFEIGKYVCWVDYEVRPRSNPDILAIDFEPDLHANDVRYNCDVIVPKGSTVASSNIIMYYLRDCMVDGHSLNDMIEREI